MGANAFILPNLYGAKNLHSVWDKVVYKFHDSPSLPFTDEAWNNLGEIANRLRADYPVDSATASKMDPMEWA